MTFKEFMNEDLEGQFGKIKAIKPSTIYNQFEKPPKPTFNKQGGSTVTRMMASDKTANTSSPRMPRMIANNRPMTRRSGIKVTDPPSFKKHKAPHGILN